MTVKINDSRKLVFVGTRGDADGGRKGHKKEELSCWEHTHTDGEEERGKGGAEGSEGGM